MKLEITFPHPPHILSANASMPRDGGAAGRLNGAKIGAKIKTREAACASAINALAGIAETYFPARLLSVEWYYSRGVKPDVDGVVARLKPLLDGCAKAFGINDRDIELGFVRRIADKTAGGTVKLIFDTELPW